MSWLPTPVPVHDPALATRWGRLTILLLLTLGLNACSLVGLAVEQSPWLIKRWVNQQVTLTPEQADALHDQLQQQREAFKRDALPVAIATLHRAAELARRDGSAQEVCELLDPLRDQAGVVLINSAPAWAQLATQLSAQQLGEWRDARREAQTQFAQDFVQASPDQVLNLRTQRALAHWERFYGDLDDAQVQRLTRHLQASPWSAPEAQRRQERRDASLLALLDRLRAGELQPDEAEAHMRRWLRQQWTPTEATARAEQRRWWAHGCAMVADMHTHMHASQREHLASTLSRYAKHLAELVPMR